VSGFKNLEKTGLDQLKELKTISGGIATLASIGSVPMVGLGGI